VTQENQAVLDDAAILARVKEIDPIGGPDLQGR
jgi:hypothetical protein